MQPQATIWGCFIFIQQLPKKSVFDHFLLVKEQYKI